MITRLFLSALLAAFSTGCASAYCRNLGECAAVYPGLQADLGIDEDEDAARRFGELRGTWVEFAARVIDAPFALVIDTLILPIDTLRYALNGFRNPGSIKRPR